MLRRLLLPGSPSRDSRQEPPPNSLQTQDEITAPDLIADLLRQARDGHNLLAVNIDGREDTYISVIIEVDAGKGYFVLDAISPREGHEAMKSQRRLSIRTRLNNVTLRFESEITAIGEEAGPAYYRLPFPERIEYVQRREHFRAAVPMEKHVPVQMVTDDENLLAAELRDISVGGFSARLRAGPLDRIANGIVVPRCVITLPDQGRLCSSAQISYADVWRPTRVLRFGARFLNMDRRSHHALEHFIAQLDRELKRKQLNN